MIHHRLLTLVFRTGSKPCLSIEEQNTSLCIRVTCKEDVEKWLSTCSRNWTGMMEYKERRLCMIKEKRKKGTGRRSKPAHLLYHSGLTFKAGSLLFFGTLLAALSSLS